MRLIRKGLFVYALALALIPVGLAGASTRPTTLLDGHTGFAARPAWVTPYVDGGVIFGGPRHPGQRFGHIHWRSWGKANAYGTGVEWANNCKPSCAGGTYVNKGGIKIHGWRAVQHHFTRLTVNGPALHHPWRLGYSHGSWFWKY